MNFEWFFIIFAPGTAGNHLSNLIATDPKFNARADVEFYSNLTNNAHTSTDFLIDHVVEKPLTANTVTCCHLASYLWHQNKIDAIAADKKYLVIEFPDFARNELFTRRLLQLYPYYENEFLIEELSTFYSVNTIRKLINVDDITPVTADKIFNKDLTALIDYLHNNFGLQLDQKSKIMHSNWIQMLEKQ